MIHPVVQAREQLKEIRLLHDTGEIADAAKMSEGELDAALQTVQRRFGLPTTTGISLTTVLKVFNSITGMNIPELGERVRLPVGLGEWRQQGIGALYRDINADLANFLRLGYLRDILGAAVVVDATKRVASVRTEDPRYRYAKHDWRRPM